ncbi:hypothetical protein J6590_052188 [Homalodisca vitripennis]|nr:hypothetical protein J6590_052188 [Homalodisca vitripennis]
MYVSGGGGDELGGGSGPPPRRASSLIRRELQGGHCRVIYVIIMEALARCRALILANRETDLSSVNTQPPGPLVSAVPERGGKLSPRNRRERLPRRGQSPAQLQMIAAGHNEGPQARLLV